MDQAEFDKFADEYRELHAANTRISGETPEFFAEYKVRDVCQVARSAGRRIARVLDFGAGVGTSVPHFRRYFPDARLTCVDVSEKSLAVGSARYPIDAEFRSFDGKALPFPDETFDLAFAACVFHHIAAEEHVALLRELHRVLRTGGMVAVFEHNPLNPVTVRAVNTCPFDENAILIPPWRMKASVKEAGFRDAGIRFRLFVPGALRRLRPIEAALHWCPLGAQYSVMGAK